MQGRLPSLLPSGQEPVSSSICILEGTGSTSLGSEQSKQTMYSYCMVPPQIPYGPSMATEGSNFKGIKMRNKIICKVKTLFKNNFGLFCYD